MLPRNLDVSPSAMVACDYIDNHLDMGASRSGRNVLTFDGAVRWMGEAEFQAQLAQPQNAAFAAALREAEARPVERPRRNPGSRG